MEAKEPTHLHPTPLIITYKPCDIVTGIYGESKETTIAANFLVSYKRYG